MVSEYIDSFDEFYKLDLSFNEFYSQHYGGYRRVDCEVGNPFEIFDENGHKIKEKRIERIERENICFVGIKKKVQYAPIGETLLQRKARRKEDFEKYMNAGCGSESMEQLDDGGAAYANEIIEIPQYDINKIEIPDFVAESYFDGRKFYYEIYFEMDIDGEDEDLEITLDSKKDMIDQLEKKFREFLGESKEIHPYLLILLGNYFTEVCEYRTSYLIDSNIMVGWEGNEGERIYKDISLVKYEREAASPLIFKLREEVSYKIDRDKLRCILLFLQDFPEYIFIFAYGLLSVSLNAKMDYRNKDENLLKKREENEIYQILPFSLCIHGTNDFLKKKDIAMMFLGYCRESKEDYRRNYNRLPYISVKKVEKNIFKLCLYKDCPFIIYPAGNVPNISATSTSVKRISHLREKNIIKGFPVFISERKIINDDMINIDVTNIGDCRKIPYRNEQGKEDIFTYKDIAVFVDGIVYEYVKYLERINNNLIYRREEDFENVSHIEKYNRESDKSKLNEEIFERYCKMFADLKYNLEQACAYRDLLTALSQFATFVHSHYPEFEPLMRGVLLKAEEIATEEALDCEIKMQQRKNNKQNTSKVRKNDVIKKFFDIVLKELELKDTYIIDEGGDFLFIDYKQFQKCYGDGNYKSFLATCRDIELLEVPKRANNGKFRGYAFDKMKNGKKYKVLKVNRKFYDKYCKMTQESKK